MRRLLLQAALGLGLFLLAIAGLRSQDRSLTLALAGDVMLGRGVAQAHQQSGWEDALAAFAPCTSAVDIAFANLESPLTSEPLVEETHDLRASPQASRALAAAGFQLVGLANNHALDAGGQGLRDTLQSLGDVGVRAAGPHENPVLLRAKELSLVWFAYDDTGEPLSEEKVAEEVAAWRGVVDLVIVAVHWGGELHSVPSERQRNLAQTMAGAGADIIVGSHPHVVQAVSWVWGAGRGRPTLVAFSLGNALFDQGAPPGSRHAPLLLVEAGASGARKVELAAFEIDPTGWRLVPASPAEAQRLAQDLGLPGTRLIHCEP